MLTDHDLIANKNGYSIDILEKHIGGLSLKTLLYTQKLTPKFCVKYIILNDEHASCGEDSYISEYSVRLAQPHISKQDLEDIYHPNIQESPRGSHC